MLFAFACLLLRRVVRLLALSSYGLRSDLEVMVLRHQLMVLRRQLGKPQLGRRDRLLMAAISTALPRAGHHFWSVRRRCDGNRELARRKWTYRWRSAGGRPPISEEEEEPRPADGYLKPRSSVRRRFNQAVLEAVYVRGPKDHQGGVLRSLRALFSCPGSNKPCESRAGWTMCELPSAA